MASSDFQVIQDTEAEFVALLQWICVIFVLFIYFFYDFILILVAHYRRYGSFVAHFVALVILRDSRLLLSFSLWLIAAVTKIGSRRRGS